MTNPYVNRILAAADKADAIAREFNQRFPVGSKVLVQDGDRWVFTTVERPAYYLGDMAVAWFSHRAGEIEVDLKTAGQFRLGCVGCDRDDHDFSDELPAEWLDIGEVQQTDSPDQWQTHLGLCPDCQRDDG
jgi:hypothetical protein